MPFKTNIGMWKDRLEAELDRRVTWREIADGTGVGYSTLLKHLDKDDFKQPDYATAQRISQWFQEMSRAKHVWTPLDYFVEMQEEGKSPQDEGEPVASSLALAN